MTLSVDLARPARVLAIGAHPDDIEFGAGATLAKWAAHGAEVTMCVCSDGSKGTWDGDADLDALVRTRATEQQAAAAALGVAHVELLGFVDGELRDDLELRAAICAVIRKSRPEVVVGHDPWKPYRLHPDHRVAGRATIEGIVAARDHHFFPEQGLAPHRPSGVLLFEAGNVNHVERTEGWVDRKVEALLAHRSQWRSTMRIDGDPEREVAAFTARLQGRARAQGIRAGLRSAEAFARLDEL